MRTDDSKSTKEKIITRVRDKKPYFCPYCRVLFNDEKYYEVKKGASKKYKCLLCDNPPFDATTFEEQAQNTKAYHIHESSDEKEVTFFIKRTVVDLKKEGFSHKEIQEITHFPRSMINNITKLHAKADRRMSVKVFLTEYLELDDEVAANILEKQPLEAKEQEQSIFKALKIGCSFDVICKILNVSRRDVTNTSAKLKDTMTHEDKTKYDSFKKSYTILFEDAQVTIKHRKKTAK
jgi:hypothetical protein